MYCTYTIKVKTFLIMRVETYFANKDATVQGKNVKIYLGLFVLKYSLLTITFQFGKYSFLNVIVSSKETLHFHRKVYSFLQR